MVSFIVLCILDGWGYTEDVTYNAIAMASTPVYDRLCRGYPFGLLGASGTDVGLPEGQIGNSEVGHMHIGAGRILEQDLSRLDTAFLSGQLRENVALNTLIRRIKQTGGTCHFLGLVSPGGVHAHQRHFPFLIKHLDDHGLSVAVHLITDGRDVLPRTALENVRIFLRDIQECSGIELATLMGRYYAMDRDKRWTRTKRAYDAIVAGIGVAGEDVVQVIERSYAQGVSDEFIEPCVLREYRGMQNGDGVLVGHFRGDRVRQILEALFVEEFAEFGRRYQVKLCCGGGLIEYGENLQRFMLCLFPRSALENTLGEVLSTAGKRQLRIAETEKYPHVTYFFNGGQEKQYKNEERVLIPSPRVATYDESPEMSAEGITEEVVLRIQSRMYDFLLVNYANPDMVGHTGDLEATVRAVEKVDQCLGRLEDTVSREGGILLVLADHGNCEVMRDTKTGSPHTAHTLSRVPMILVNRLGYGLKRSGRLCDVAPTVLELMGISPPPEMTGRSLITKA